MTEQDRINCVNFAKVEIAYQLLRGLILMDKEAAGLQVPAVDAVKELGVFLEDRVTAQEIAAREG